MTTVTDPWAIVAQAQAGGDSAGPALAALCERYRDTIYRYVYRRTGNAALADDITQGVFVRALGHIDRLTVRAADPGAWLYTIARNRIYDHWKSGRMRFEAPVGDMWDVDQVDLAASPEALAIAGVVTGTVRAALGRLTPAQRQAVQLRYLEGLSVEEAATRLGMTTGSVKALTYRAVRSLARYLPEGIAA